MPSQPEDKPAPIRINLKPTKFLIAMKCQAVTREWERLLWPALIPTDQQEDTNMEPQPIQTTVEMDHRVKTVVAFMQHQFPAHDLRGIAEAVALVAPSVWGNFRYEQIVPLSVSGLPMVVDPNQRRQTGS